MEEGMAPKERGEVVKNNLGRNTFERKCGDIDGEAFQRKKKAMRPWAGNLGGYLKIENGKNFPEIYKRSLLLFL